MTEPGSHEFTVTESELLLDAPIIAVRRDQVTMPGGSVSAREIVEHFGAVAVLAFDGVRIALVRQYRHCVRDRLWELPAGLLDLSDEDPLQCAIRELTEEAGLRAGRWDLLTDVVSSPGFCEEAVRVYLARDLSEVERPETSDDEESDMILTWFDPGEVHRMVVSGQIVNSIAVAGIMVGLDVIAGRSTPRSVDEPFRLRPTSLPRRRGVGRAPGTDLKRL
ncbi:NUDIX hydrolase [Corynebacterium marambiense]|uniref:NUDIX hydrolase n=1 Tax=Corynebacterium marambiense TaxID=2765364 RepID=UPI002B21BBDE|nr:NUDIX hydrolase [Corynebacterium marambiense]